MISLLVPVLAMSMSWPAVSASPCGTRCAVTRPGASLAADPMAPEAFSTQSAASETPREDAAAGAVVMLVIDGVRWQDMFPGGEGPSTAETEGDSTARSAREFVPNLHRLVAERGIAFGGPGCPNAVSASGPNYVSLPGYMELLTGRWDTGCSSNACPRTAFPSLVDDVQREFGAAQTAAVFSSWGPVERAVRSPETTPISAGRSLRANLGPAYESAPLTSSLAAGAVADPFPGNEEYRPDTHTAEAALAYFEYMRPRLLFLALGDTDEFAHRDDFEGYVGALRQADRVVGSLADMIDRMGPSARSTTVLVTADHGRANNFRDHGGGAPESARSFLFAFGPQLSPRGVSCATRPLRLADVSATARALLGLEPLDGERVGRPIEEVVSGVLP